MLAATVVCPLVFVLAAVAWRFRSPLAAQEGLTPVVLGPLPCEDLA